ncbi:MAG: hypothetical protein ABF381_08730 [Akkermansiaceae bacterium]|jgi:predicted negative regulator of RcsB-dependent stress response
MSENTDQNPDDGPSPIGEISQEPSAFEAFLDANQKKLIILGILAILCLVGYVVVTGLQKMAKEDAAAAVADARTVPQYEAVSKEYAGENAGGSAILLKSQLLWGDQLQQDAIETLETFVTDYPEHPAVGSAYASLGSYQQQLQNYDKAKEAFQKAADSESAASSLGLLSLGDLALQAGEDEKAEGIYNKIISEYESSHLQVKSMAQNRLKLINVDSPTEKAPEPPKPPSTPGAITPPVKVPGITPAVSPSVPTPGTAEPSGETTTPAKPDINSEPESTPGAETEPTPEGDPGTETTTTNESVEPTIPAGPETPAGSTPE